MKHIRFHLDEHVDPRIAHALRRVDIDVTTTVEAQLRTSNDENQWHYARNEQRVLVTCDTDFPDRANRDLHHPGIVYFDKDTRTIGDVVEWLTLMHGAMSAEEIDGLIEYVPKR
jgi:predicted nuclease of predicted toxin-antitoxin system